MLWKLPSSNFRFKDPVHCYNITDYKFIGRNIRLTVVRQWQCYSAAVCHKFTWKTMRISIRYLSLCYDNKVTDIGICKSTLMLWKLPSSNFRFKAFKIWIEIVLWSYALDQIFNCHTWDWMIINTLYTWHNSKNNKQKTNII
jgi:hypothetical protein